MNATCIQFPEESLEQYSRGELGEKESASLEEHLLLCVPCQAKLEELDDYGRIMQAACESLIRKPAAGTCLVRRNPLPPRQSA